jgi:hypothetical protein
MLSKQGGRIATLFPGKQGRTRANDDEKIIIYFVLDTPIAEIGDCSTRAKLRANLCFGSMCPPPEPDLGGHVARSQSPNGPDSDKAQKSELRCRKMQLNSAMHGSYGKLVERHIQTDCGDIKANCERVVWTDIIA